MKWRAFQDVTLKPGTLYYGYTAGTRHGDVEGWGRTTDDGNWNTATGWILQGSPDLVLCCDDEPITRPDIPRPDIPRPDIPRPTAAPYQVCMTHKWVPVAECPRLKPGRYVCQWIGGWSELCERKAGAWWFEGSPANDEVSHVMDPEMGPIGKPDDH